MKYRFLTSKLPKLQYILKAISTHINKNVNKVIIYYLSIRFVTKVIFYMNNIFIIHNSQFFILKKTIGWYHRIRHVYMAARERVGVRVLHVTSRRVSSHSVGVCVCVNMTHV